MKKNLSLTNLIIYCIYFFPISILFGNLIINFNLLICSILFILFFFRKKNFRNYFSIELALLFLFIFINILSNLTLEKPNFNKSFGLLRFLFFGLCVNYYFANNLINKIKYQKYILFIIFFVCIDALIQSIFYTNLIGIKKEAVYLSGVFGDEKILGSYLSKILIFALPFLFNQLNTKKIFFLALVFFIILQTTERSGLFIFLNSSLIFFLVSKIHLKKKIFITVTSFFILIILFISVESLRINLLFKTLHQFGFEKLNKKIILLIDNDCKIKNSSNDNLLCVEEKYYNIKKHLGLHNLVIGGNFGIFSQNHIAHILVSLKIWNEYKFFGIGVGNFRYYSYDDKYKLNNELYNKIKASTHPHSIYTQILVETGLVGFCLFFSSIVVIIYKKIKLFRKIKYINYSELAFFIIFIIHLIPLPSGNVFGTSYGIFFWLFILLNINFGKKISKI